MSVRAPPLGDDAENPAVIEQTLLVRLEEVGQGGGVGKIAGLTSLARSEYQQRARWTGGDPDRFLTTNEQPRVCVVIHVRSIGMSHGGL